MIRLLMIPVAFAVMLMQAPQGGDPENGAPEPGQPLHCDNYLKTAPDMRCACGRALQKCTTPTDPPEDVKMDRRCRTYCRAQHCLCMGAHCNG